MNYLTHPSKTESVFAPPFSLSDTLIPIPVLSLMAAWGWRTWPRPCEYLSSPIKNGAIEGSDQFARCEARATVSSHLALRQSRRDPLLTSTRKRIWFGSHLTLHGTGGDYIAGCWDQHHFASCPTASMVPTPDRLFTQTPPRVHWAQCFCLSCTQGYWPCQGQLPDHERKDRIWTQKHDSCFPLGKKLAKRYRI